MDRYFYCNICDMYGVINVFPSITVEEFNNICKCSCGNKNVKFVDTKVVMMNHNIRIIDLLSELVSKG